MNANAELYNDLKKQVKAMHEIRMAVSRRRHVIEIPPMKPITPLLAQNHFIL
jgi:hypothetical protein